MNQMNCINVHYAANSSKTCETTSRGSIILGIVTLIVSVVAVVLLSTVFSSCEVMEDGSYMGCHNAQIAEAVALLVVGLLAIASVSLSTTGKIITSVAGCTISVVAMIRPGLFLPLCMMENMLCHTRMIPAARIFAAVLLGMSVASIATAIRCAKTGSSGSKIDS